MKSNTFSRKILLLLFLFFICLAMGAYLYRKKKHSSGFITQQTRNSQTVNSRSNSNTNFFFDFETLDGLSGTENIKTTFAHSGKMACDLSNGSEYGPSVIKKLSDITSMPLKKISASVWIYSFSDNPNVVLTASVINSKNESVFWDGKGTEHASWIQKNKWTKINASYNLPSDKISADDIVHVNIWNKGKTNIIIDDLEIVYGESPERRGLDATLDPAAIYEKRFVPQRNKPPFKTIYFEKQEINNGNSTFITSKQDNTFADFSPNDKFLVGNFTADKNNLDEIVCIKKDAAAMFEYAAEDQQFIKLWENNNTQKTAWSDDTKNFAGDFNADGKTDLLIVNNKNGSWELFDFNNKNWDLILKGNNNLNSIWVDDKNKSFVSDFFSKDKNDALVILNENNYSMLQLNRKTNSFEETDVNLSANDTALFKTNSNIYVGNFAGGTRQEFLKFNTDWRFDFKLIDIDSTGFYIASTIDFKGYPNDYNPKYYEFLKIIPGKFMSSSKKSLLVMMRNCSDSSFNGIHCNQFENLSTLPNSTQLYNLVKP